MAGGAVITDEIKQPSESIRHFDPCMHGARHLRNTVACFFRGSELPKKCQIPYRPVVDPCHARSILVLLCVIVPNSVIIDAVENSIFACDKSSVGGGAIVCSRPRLVRWRWGSLSTISNPGRNSAYIDSSSRM